MTARLALALVAAAALLALDVFVVAALFLYRPAGGELFGLAMLAVALSAIPLRRRWLLFAAHNAATALTLLRLAQAEGPAEPREIAGALVFLLVVAGGGNLLAWLVARAIPARRPA